jgi:hypothetical protein
MSTVAAIAAPLIASPLGLTAWLVTTHIRSGSISVTTSGDLPNALAGSATSCGMGVVVAVLFSLIFPYKYTSADAAHTDRVEKIRGTSALEGREIPEDLYLRTEIATSDETKPSTLQAPTDVELPSGTRRSEAVALTGNDVVDFLVSNHIEPLDLKSFYKARRLAISACAVFFVFAMVLFPFTFYGTGIHLYQSRVHGLGSNQPHMGLLQRHTVHCVAGCRELS